MTRELDQTLILRSGEAADALDRLWTEELRKKKPRRTFKTVTQEWLNEEGPLAAPLRVQDLQGRTLAATREFPKLLKPLGGAWQRDFVFRIQEYDGKSLRLISRTYMHDGDLLALIQSAVPYEPVDKALSQLRRWLIWLISATLLTTAAVGWVLAGGALRPIEMVTRRAREVSADRLDERVPVPRSSDELYRLATTFNDMLARLENAFNGLRQFSSAASHELRTPLTVMRGELEVALRRPRTAEEYQNVLRTHLSTISDMTRVVEDLAMLAHREAADETIEWSLVDLGELSEQCAQRWGAEAASKGIAVDRSRLPSVYVHGEQCLLERLVSTLIENGIRRSPPEGRVTLSVGGEGARVRLSVQDSGPALSAEELERVFERYFRPSESSNGDDFSGMGLGICRWISEAHHGKLEASSAGGRGTTFILWLPLTQTLSVVEA